MAHVSLVTLGVDDLVRATAFYESLGWRRSSSSVDGTVTFFHGAPVLALFDRGALAADARVPRSQRDAPASVALGVNVDSEAAVDGLVDAAARAGATVPKPPERTEWGGYTGYFLDDDGHLWEVAHNPSFRLLPDGRIVLPDAG